MDKVKFGFEYKGYTYQYDLDIEPEENCKINHWATVERFGSNPDDAGCIESVEFDWSPYSYPTEEDFKLWVDLGCPARIGNGPLRREDLDYIRGAGLVTFNMHFTFVNGFGEEREMKRRVTCASPRLAREIVLSVWPSAKIYHVTQNGAAV